MNLDFTTFVSYAHRDEENTNGRISLLATQLTREFEILSGQRLQLFLDRDEDQGLDFVGETFGET